MLFALGFVFMFTIGGLIIHLALPLKITICWELLTIILLGIIFISVTMYNFEQSAGNLWIQKNILVGTLETTRDPCNFFTRRYSPLNKNSLTHLYNNNYNKIIICLYSTSNNKDNKKNWNSVIVYDNFKEDRFKILNEQKDKSGVYCLINNINGLIRLKVEGLKKSCDYLGVKYREADYNIKSYDPYLAGLVDTDGTIVYNYTGNRIECNLEFKYNKYINNFYNS